MHPSFEGKTALITGAASGIGRETALLLAQRGCQALILADLDLAKVSQSCQEITASTGRECLPWVVDVAQAASVDALFAHAERIWGGLHILVNAAGICPYLSIEETGPQQWDRTLDINLRGSYLCARAALALMKPRRYGKIVNIASLAARVGGIASSVDYVASKGGVVSMTYSFAKACTPWGINVNGVAPGMIDTPLIAAHSYPPGTVIGQPRDVAHVIAFLASEEARHIQGCTIDVNGGLYMH